MLYELMLSGIGFLTACLLMAILAPIIHERAVRLTVRRLSARRPRSVIDRRAHEDQLRAQFAVSVCRLETAIEDTQAKAASHLCELAKRSAEIAHLKAELRRTNLVILRFQARELMRRTATRSIVKLGVYLFERWQRHGRRADAAGARHARFIGPRWEHFPLNRSARLAGQSEKAHFNITYGGAGAGAPI